MLGSLNGNGGVVRLHEDDESQIDPNVRKDEIQSDSLGGLPMDTFIVR